MKTSFYSNSELQQLGFKSIGENCLISRFSRFYNIGSIELGDYVRIDDFSILSGNICLGSFVHISAYCALYGKMGIKIGDYSGMSPNSIIYSAMDDFSGNFMINPMVPDKYTNVKGGPVTLEKYVQLGGNTIVTPNLIIGEGSVTGFFSFVNKDLGKWNIYAGIPVRIIKKREKNILNLVKFRDNPEL